MQTNNSSQEPLSYQILLLCLALSFASTALAYALANCFGDVLPWTPFVKIWGLAAVLILGLFVWLRLNHSFTAYVATLVLSLFFISVINTLFSIYELINYGDVNWLPELLSKGAAFPRWLLGTSILSTLYAALWEMPAVKYFLPPHLTNPEAFIRLTASLAMTIAALYALKTAEQKTAVVLAILCPFGIAFLTGYIEYYPFSYSTLLVFYTWLFRIPLGKHRPLAISLWASLLPLFYIGFIPISIIVLVLYCLEKQQVVLLTLWYCALFLFAGIRLFWSRPPASFFRHLWQSMNFGELSIQYPRYKGLSAGPDSVFFRSDYVVSIDHLWDVSYAYVFCAGSLTLPLLLVALLLCMKQCSFRDLNQNFRTSRFWMIVLLLFSQFYFIFFMIPKLGPRRDIDLFCHSYLTMLFISGYLVDTLTGRSLFQTRKSQLILFSVLIGVIIATDYWLLLEGIPEV